MDIQKAYNKWSATYDEVENKTRDLEGIVFRELLSGNENKSVLEIGCGTGKNTLWLSENYGKIYAVDFSEEMLKRAGSKISSENVKFIQADINKHWEFADYKFDLITFSLVLEHIENLDHVFREASASLVENGSVYVGELHPYKQYSGSKARFESETGINVIGCFNHHISDFIGSALKAGLQLSILNEYFDSGKESDIPRILALLFKKVTRK